MRYSLREVLLFVGVVSFAVPALWFASPLLKSSCLLATFLVVGSCLICVLFDRGPHQAFAIGFLAIALLYWGALLAGSGALSKKMAPYEGHFFTTELMEEPLKWATRNRSYWIDGFGNRSKTRLTGTGGGGSGIFLVEVPCRQSFMTIAHCLWTLLFGYLGGKYAASIYQRRSIAKTPPDP